VVLLKNENNALPLNLNGIKSIAVIGNNATKKNALGGFGAG
jgi:beta-glucosidase